MIEFKACPDIVKNLRQRALVGDMFELEGPTTSMYRTYRSVEELFLSKTGRINVGHVCCSSGRTFHAISSKKRYHDIKN